MVNPNARNAMPIAEGLDDSHMMRAISNGAETSQNMQELVQKAQEKRRHLAEQAFVAFLQSSESAA